MADMWFDFDKAAAENLTFRQRVADLEAALRDTTQERDNLIKTRDQLVRERDAHKRGEDLANQDRESHKKRVRDLTLLVTDLKRQVSLKRVDVERQVKARTANQTTAYRDLMNAYGKLQGRVRALESGERLQDLTARLRNKNKLLTQALKELDAALNDGMKARRERNDAVARNNADCLVELNKTVRLANARKYKIESLNGRVLELEDQLAKAASTEPSRPGWFKIGNKVEWRYHQDAPWRTGALVSYEPEGGATVRDEGTGQLITLGQRLRKPVLSLDWSWNGKATSEQIAAALKILEGK